VLHQQLAALPHRGRHCLGSGSGPALRADRVRHACIIGRTYDNAPGCCLACPFPLRVFEIFYAGRPVGRYSRSSLKIALNVRMTAWTYVAGIS